MRLLLIVVLVGLAGCKSEEAASTVVRTSAVRESANSSDSSVTTQEDVQNTPAHGFEELRIPDGSPLTHEDIIRIAKGKFLEYHDDPLYADKFAGKWAELRRKWLGTYKQDEPLGDVEFKPLRISAVAWEHVPGGWTFTMAGDVKREPLPAPRWSIVSFYFLPGSEDPIIELITLDRVEIVSERSPETNIDIKHIVRELN